MGDTQPFGCGCFYYNNNIYNKGEGGADRIPVKHLLTLQEGVSEAQFREMTQAQVQLVVPEPLIAKFPASIRTDIVTLESFLADLRLLT